MNTYAWPASSCVNELPSGSTSMCSWLGAPTTITSPYTATGFGSVLFPNRDVSHASSSNPVLNAHRECVTPTSTRTNTYATGQNQSFPSEYAVSASVVATSTSPSTATVAPKPSSSNAYGFSSRSSNTNSEVRSPAVARANTNTEPMSMPVRKFPDCVPSAELSRFSALTTTTSPSTATAKPKLSSSSRVGLCSFWRNVQSDEGTPATERVNTYTDPALVTVPCGSFHFAPTASVSPSRSSDPAKKSPATPSGARTI